VLPPNTNLSFWIQSGAEIIQQRFTAPENYNLYPSAHLHTQWLSGYGKGVMGDPTFDAYFASTVPSIIDPVLQQTAVRDAGAKLIERIGKKVILIGHSQGGVPLWLIADRAPELVRMIVALEPAGPPFQDPAVFGRRDARSWGLSDIPITYSPPVTDPSADIVKTRIPASNGSEECVLQADDPPPRELVNLKGVRSLVVQAEASWHVLYDWCTVKFLKQAGVDAELVDLASKGVKGNGHMLMLEKNSDEVAEVVRVWIEGE
jgi:pimeloyl-ACP methyl ester carboxylesterase